MRHSATLISALEGMSRPAFHIGKELYANSRSGLTLRFLSKKLEAPEEEVEYLVDLHHKLFFHDITKVKLVAEGGTAIKRICEGLENRGDADAWLRIVKNMSQPEFRQLEEYLGIQKPEPKKATAELLLQEHYKHPESIVDYVATKGFSALAQELFDIVWQSDDGVMSVSVLRAAHGASEYKVEQALNELFIGGALFEMFRFDDQERLVRMVGLLAELRQWFESQGQHGERRSKLKSKRELNGFIDARGLEFSDRICRLVASIAAKPVRLRGDGELFREDRRRLSDIVSEEDEPPLTTCLWVAEGAGWLARVDNELRAADLDALMRKSRVERHQEIFEWLIRQNKESQSRRLMSEMLDDLKAGAWYPVVEFVEYTLSTSAHGEQPTLMNQGGHWRYIAPGAGASTQRSLGRSLEESFHWLGVVDRAHNDGDAWFRVTNLGAALLLALDLRGVEKELPEVQNEIIVQPNFDIVVPALEVDPLLTVPLDQFAVRQSSGTALVYHLDRESFTKAIQEGHDGRSFVQYLLAHNRGGALPDNVLQTLEDWLGSMKRVRVRTISVLEADDPLVIADIKHRKRFGKYLEDVDPKRMLAFPKEVRDELIKELEKEGFVIG